MDHNEIKQVEKSQSLSIIVGIILGILMILILSVFFPSLVNGKIVLQEASILPYGELITVKPIDPLLVFEDYKLTYTIDDKFKEEKLLSNYAKLYDSCRFR